MPSTPASRPPALFFATAVIWTLGLLASGWSPYDRTTWWLEVAPCLVGFAIMWASATRFPLTQLLYVLIIIHGLVLMLGGAYTYARVPLGFWMQEWFGGERNNYDKIGHFMQGFVPAIIAREIMIRRWNITRRGVVAFLAISICLAFSALYELIEWWAALALGQGADEFLGTQGDPWDTQSDMFLALIGAACALLFLSRWHDRQIAAVSQTTSA